MPYTSLNGHMFSFMTETGKLALRQYFDLSHACVANLKPKPTSRKKKRTN
jgi:hypothetical protein